MSRNNTGNPLGSKAFLDFEDNVRNLDQAVNSNELSWRDRLGRDRKSFEGMEREFDADQAFRDNAFESAQTYRENEFDSAQTYRENEFDSAQYSREARFNDFISASGYQPLGDYGPGIEFTEYNQLVRDENGEFWRVSGQVDLPYVTTGAGIPEGDALVPAGDAVLRQELDGDVATGQGARMVRGAVIYVDTIADLQALDTSGLLDGQPIIVKDEGVYQYSAAADELYPVSSQHNFHRLGDPVRLHHPTVPYLPMGDQGLDGQAVHPCVVKIPEGFGPQGFTYWMAVTPYQNGNDQTENPCIFGSHDGAAWEVPDGVTNPLVASPGTTQDHLSDTNLMYHNGELWLYYRETLKSTDPRQDNIYLIKSSDGANWTAPVQCDLPDSDLALSPAVVHDGSQFVMYLLRRANEVDRRTSIDGINWSLPSPVSFVGASTAWHIHVVICNGRYEMLINTSVTNGSLVFAHSDLSDGLVFERTNIVAGRKYDFESGGLYHGCLTPEGAESARIYDIWYSAQAGSRWTVAHVAATLSGEGLVPTYDRQPVTVFGPITATAGHFSTVSTKDGFAKTAAIVTDPLEASGGPRNTRAIIASVGCAASNTRTSVLSGFNCSATGQTSSVIASTDNCQASGARSSVISSRFSSAASGDGGTVISSQSCDASGARSSVIASSGSQASALGGASMVAASVGSEASQTSSVVAGSLNSTASGNKSAVIASSASLAGGLSSTAIACTDGANASGPRSAIMANQGGEASGDRSAIIACTRGLASAQRSFIAASNDCEVNTGTNAIISSLNVINNTAFSLALGHATSGDPSTSNQKIRLDGQTGTVRATNTTIAGLDYAELFPNGTGSEIPPGTILTLRGGAVLPAERGDWIVGVVSHTYGILGGDTFACWQGRYLKDEWGRDVWEEIEDPDEPGEMVRVRAENPDYDPEQEYVPRTDRPDEWTPVGLLGQVLVRVSESVQSGDSVAAESGIGVVSNDLTGLMCLGIESGYDPALGYAIAKCLINVRV